MSRKPVDSLGELQQAALEAVWRLGEGTVVEVREAMGREPEPAYTTVLSVMQKLEKLGWLTHRAEGRTYVYRATRTREQAGTGSVRRLVDRVFGGDRMLLLQHLIDERELSASELVELRRLIDRKRKERGRD
jgi:predicted transcriptional regulator